MMRGLPRAQIARLNGTFIPLLVALLVVLVLAPLVNQYRLLTSVMVSLLLLAGVFTVHRHHALRIAAVLGLALTLCLRWMAHFVGYEQEHWLVLSHAMIAGYMAFLTMVVFCTVLTHREITRNTVMGATCGYLLIGYVFAFCYLLLEECCPGSIVSGGQAPGLDDSLRLGRGGPEFIYFSFATLTTLGYGDILPISPLARSLTILEVLGGQLYLAAFVARLVGVMRARSDGEHSDTGKGDSG